MKLTKAIAILKQHNDSRRNGTDKVHPINLATAIDEVVNSVDEVIGNYNNIIKYYNDAIYNCKNKYYFVKELEFYKKEQLKILKTESKRIFKSGVELKYNINFLKRKKDLTYTEKRRLSTYIEDYDLNIINPTNKIAELINELDEYQIDLKKMGPESEFFN